MRRGWRRRYWPGGTSTSSGDTATFNSASSITFVVITNVGGIGTWNIKNITFDTANCAAYIITNAGGTTTRFTGGGSITINSTVTQPQLITGSQFRLHTTGALNLVNNSATPTATLTFAAGVKANNSTETLQTDQAVNFQGSNTGSNSFSGVIADYDNTRTYLAAVTKSGAGTWYLSANNTYTGPTIITGGLLASTGSGSINSSTNVVLNGSGATLSVANTLNLTSVNVAMSVTNSGTLAITNTAYRTPVTVPILIVSNATVHVGVNGLTPFTNIVVTAASGLNAGPNITFSIDQVANVATATTFAVMSYTGTDPDAADFAATAVSGYTVGPVTVDTVNKLVIVTVTPASAIPSLVWVGALSDTTPDSNWNTTDQNWLNTGVYSAYADPDFVQFDDTASASAVSLNMVVSPSSMTVSNDVLNYTFSGSGKINGTLTKDGSADLTLAETGGDDFTGGLVIHNGTVVLDNASGTMTGNTTIGATGTLQLGNNDANGTMPSGTVTDNGTLVFNRTADVAVGSVISGGGSLSQINSDTVSLNGANTYNGNTTISAGTIKVNNYSALGATNSGSGSVTISSGGTLDLGGITTANVAGGFEVKAFSIAGSGAGGNGVIVNSGTAQQQNAFQSVTLTANATIGGPTRWDIRGGAASLDLAGFTLTKTGTNQISLVSPHVTGGNVIIDQGTLSFESSIALTGSGTVTVNSGGTLGHYRSGPNTFTRPVILNGGAIQVLSSGGGFCTNDAPITLTANSSLVGSTSSTYPFYLNGVIDDGGAGYGITKTGAGLVILSAASTYTGNTTIKTGTLTLTGSASIGQSANISVAGGATFDVSALTAPFALNSGQTLSGAGTVTGPVVAGSGATLAPGTNGIGTLSFGNDLTLDAATINTFNVTSAGGASNKMAVAGTLTPSSSVIQVTSGSPLVPGVYPLVTYGAVSGAFSPTPTFDVAPVHPGASVVDNGTGLISLVVPNQAPVANTMTVVRNAGVNSTKIALSDLATNWSDPDGDAVSFVSVNGSTNGATISTNAGLILYNNANSVNDQISYVVTDAYGATSTGLINIVINNSGLFGQTSPSLSTIGGTATLNFAGIPGYSYSVQVSTDLTTWNTVWTTNAPPTGLFQFTDNSAPQPSAYYRLEWNP